MNRLLVILLSLFAYMHVVEAGSKKLSRNQNLSWTFVGSDSVTFTYTIPKSEGKNYDYWGLGFQAVGTSGMKEISSQFPRLRESSILTPQETLCKLKTRRITSPKLPLKL